MCEYVRALTVCVRSCMRQAIEQKTQALNDSLDTPLEYNIPGLLVIDTPGARAGKLAAAGWLAVQACNTVDVLCCAAPSCCRC